MGTDIHSVAQIKKNGKFTTVEVHVAGDKRQYNTFAILAGVCNGTNILRMKTGDGYIPISKPRGLPADFQVVDNDHPVPFEWYDWDDETRSYPNREISMGDHSHSWLLLSELELYAQKAATLTTYSEGIVSRAEWERCQLEKSSPQDWSTYIAGPRVIIATEETAAIDTSATYIRMRWQVGYLESSNLLEIIEALQKIRDKHKTTSDQVRYVFGFDS